jgi:hypothetical protein
MVDDEWDDAPRIEAPDDGQTLADDDYYEEIVILDLRPAELRDRW